MTYQLSDNPSFREQKMAFYELIAEKLQSQMNCPVPPFSQTFFATEYRTLWIKWPNGVSIHLSIISGRPFCGLTMSIPNGVPYRKEISVTFDELLDHRLVEIAPN